MITHYFFPRDCQDKFSIAAISEYGSLFQLMTFGHSFTKYSNPLAIRCFKALLFTHQPNFVIFKLH